ncbi:MAG: hypothetical protein NVSMB27_33800 [Ktedonobacteraceae bacterium]
MPKVETGKQLFHYIAYVNKKKRELLEDWYKTFRQFCQERQEYFNA